MTFRVGMKVVCVDSAPIKGHKWSGDAPVIDEIYTIARLIGDDDGDLIFHLNEILRCPRARAQWGDDVGYAARRFRPLVSRQTDISALQALLVPGAKIREEA